MLHNFTSWTRRCMWERCVPNWMQGIYHELVKVYHNHVMKRIYANAHTERNTEKLFIISKILFVKRIYLFFVVVRTLIHLYIRSNALCNVKGNRYFILQPFYLICLASCFSLNVRYFRLYWNGGMKNERKTQPLKCNIYAIANMHWMSFHLWAIEKVYIL